MEKINISINRSGTFKIKKSQFCPTQCGENGKKEYKYEVSIEGTDDGLNEPDYFLIDNLIIKEYFEWKYNHNMCQVRSCELVSIDAVRDLKKICEEENPKCGLNKITVIIRGSEHSFIKSEWVRS